ncbi:hypothetical protein [Streptomyces colonosanans]|uniref:Uncharacterized protein n=1 Tax=Streptomyces colonosanans TaxID=1428652 RepID=A0A1S2PNQ4_9ACTN|nr:hypothetical protein [Streptomyces colonosanans]OIJ95431.1 hypothetical protein BIV24_09120 [Streptomyces colonosanans]
MPSHRTTAHSPIRKAAAARMRAIGLNRLRPLPRSGPSFLCSRCSTSWTGAEADCFSCGLPATQEYSHPHAALQVLLIAVGRTPDFNPDLQPEVSR